MDAEFDKLFKVVTCVKCAHVFALDKAFHELAQRNHDTYFSCSFCGVRQHFVGETSVEKLGRLLESLRSEYRVLTRQLASQKRSHAATRGHLTRRNKELAALKQRRSDPWVAGWRARDARAVAHWFEPQHGFSVCLGAKRSNTKPLVGKFGHRPCTRCTRKRIK